MCFINNESLIKELIKKDYNIPLSQIQEIDFVLTKTKITTVEDYDKLINYLNGYTERSAKTLDFWDMKASTEQYLRYVKSMEKVSEFKRFPREDIYFLTEAMYQAKRKITDDMIAEKAYELVQKNKTSPVWAGCDAK